MRASTAADRPIVSESNTRRLDGERPTRHSRLPLQTAFALGGRCTGRICHIGAPRPTRSRVTIAGGRFPGSRVVASGHLPRDPKVPSGIHGRPLAAYSCGGSCGIARRIGRAHRIPLASPCGHHQGQRCIRFAQRQLRICRARQDAAIPVMRAAPVRRPADALKPCGAQLKEPRPAP
jgi:hypothetical protein